jgi:diphthamide synthase (EF-2-diphthine--ammonia ligase)
MRTPAGLAGYSVVQKRHGTASVGEGLSQMIVNNQAPDFTGAILCERLDKKNLDGQANLPRKYGHDR